MKNDVHISTFKAYLLAIAIGLISAIGPALVTDNRYSNIFESLYGPTAACSVLILFIGSFVFRGSEDTPRTAFIASFPIVGVISGVIAAFISESGFLGAFLGSGIGGCAGFTLPGMAVALFEKISFKTIKGYSIYLLIIPLIAVIAFGVNNYLESVDKAKWRLELVKTASAVKNNKRSLPLCSTIWSDLGLTDEKRHLCRGTYFWKNGSRYDGEWKNKKQHGYGILSKSGETVYIGNWANGQRHGHGTYTWEDGTKFSGDWENGKMNGLGMLKSTNGKEKHGIWENDRFIGSWTLCDVGTASFVYRFKNCNNISSTQPFYNPDLTKYK